MTGLTDWFNAKPGFDQSDIYTIATKNGPSGHAKQDSWSAALRLLMHYVGDSHQPLHGTTRLDKEYAEGDRGGNDFPLPSHYGAKELHAVWDKVVYEFSKNPKLPFDTEGWSTQGDQADKLIADHPVSSLGYDVTNLDYNQWEKESFEIASTFVYKGIKEGEKLSDDYVSQGLKYAEKRIVTAGYRLANLLKSLTHLK